MKPLMRSPQPMRPAQLAARRSPSRAPAWTPVDHPLEVLAPLDGGLPARMHLPRRRYPSEVGRRVRPERGTDPDHRPGGSTTPARQHHLAAPARPGPRAALAGLATRRPPIRPRPRPRSWPRPGTCPGVTQAAGPYPQTFLKLTSGHATGQPPGAVPFCRAADPAWPDEPGAGDIGHVAGRGRPPVAVRPTG